MLTMPYIKQKPQDESRFKLVKVTKKLFRRKPLRIAVIDDDPIILTILEDMFKSIEDELKFTLNIKTFQ